MTPFVLRFFASYTVQRAATAGVVLLSSLIAAQLLGAALYGELAFFVFIAKTILLGNFGAVSGFIVDHYTGDIAAQARAAGKFKNAYTIHLLVVAAICFATGIWAGPAYGFAALGFTVLIPFFVLEPQARIQRKFYVSLIPDLILSTAVIGGTLTYVFFLRSNIGPWPLLWVGLVWMVVLSVAVAWAIWPSLRNPELQVQQSDWTSYQRLIAIGMPRFCATCAFTIFLMVDRVFIERFYDRAELGVYMLGFQLAFGASLLLSAQNLVSGIDVGEAIRKSEISRQMLQQLLKRSLGLGGLGLGSVAVFSYMLEHHFLSGYTGLFQVTAFLSMGLVAFMTAGNLTDLAYYQKAHRPLMVGFFLLIVLCVSFNILNLYLFHGTIRYLSTFTGSLLLVYAIAAIFFTQRIAASLNSKAI